MQTTNEFLDAVAKAHGNASDYRLAKVLDITRASVSNLRHGKTCLGDETALKVAAELKLEPGYVLACIYAERATRADAPEVRRAWETVAARVAAAVILGIGVGGLLAVMAPESAPALLQYVSGDCVLCKMIVRSNVIDLAPIFAAVLVCALTLLYLSRSQKR